MFTRLHADMDINCGLVIDGELSVEQMGERIFQHILRAASGERTKSELLGLGDHGFVPWRLGIAARGGGNAGGANADVPAAWSVNRTRPLCPHPLVARYEGGDNEAAAGFAFER